MYALGESLNCPSLMFFCCEYIEHVDVCVCVCVCVCVHAVLVFYLGLCFFCIYCEKNVSRKCFFVCVRFGIFKLHYRFKVFLK